jgi:hypothetical protein
MKVPLEPNSHRIPGIHRPPARVDQLLWGVAEFAVEAPRTRQSALQEPIRLPHDHDDRNAERSPNCKSSVIDRPPIVCSQFSAVCAPKIAYNVNSPASLKAQGWSWQLIRNESSRSSGKIRVIRPASLATAHVAPGSSTAASVYSALNTGLSASTNGP